MRNRWIWMRTSQAGLWLLVLLALFLIPVPRLVAQTNTHSQVLYLPDPTPRPKDPDLVYGHNQDDQPRVDNKSIADINAKRRALVEWAATQLIALSDRLEAEVREPQTASSLAAAKGNADKIEKLAKNLATALKAP